MPQGKMEIAAEAEANSNMVGEWHERQEGLRRGEEGGVHEPIKVAAMFLSGRGCVGYATVPVPLGGKVGRSYVPVAPD